MGEGEPTVTTRLRACLLALALAGCGDDSVQPPTGPIFVPTTPRLLSAGSPTKDEDPSVLRASDGTLYVAWFSDRGGNNDIYLTRTTDGEEWLSPVRITTHAGGDFYPNLIQDEQGTFHLTWFRWTALYIGSIVYNSSADGVTWSESAEQPVTSDADVDDWVPSITRLADGTLLVYFVSDARDGANPTNEIYVARRGPGATVWDAPVALAANSATLHDHLPFAARIDGEVTLVWTRSVDPVPWQTTDADLYVATSADGVSWSAATAITNDASDVVHVFPAWYASLDGDWSLVWVSTRLGAPAVFELPQTALGNYPTGAVLVDLPPGYSHRIAPTSTPGIYLGVWVQGPEGSQDIWYRFFQK